MVCLFKVAPLSDRLRLQLPFAVWPRITWPFSRAVLLGRQAHRCGFAAPSAHWIDQGIVRRLLSAVVWCLLAGCASAVAPLAVDSACSSDSDCLGGLKCYDKRLCVAAQVPETTVIVRMTPPANSGLLVDQLKLTLDGATQGQPLKLQLSDPAVIYGSVAKDGFNLGLIPGVLIASAHSDVEGRNLIFTATSLTAVKLFAGSDKPAGFELRVQSGHDYDVAFWPQNDQIPPHYTTIVVNGSIENWNIQLPKDEQLLHVEGKFVAGPDAPKSLQMQNKLAVWLQDAKGRLCSSRGVTDAAGHFHLLVDPSSPDGVLVFEPVDPQDALPHGRFAKPVTAHATAKTGEPPPPPLLIDLGQWQPAKPFTITVLDSNAQPVPGALVRVQQPRKQSPLKPSKTPQQAKLSAFFVDQQDITDKFGVVHLQLPPSDGDDPIVTVLPPPEALAGRIAPQALALPTVGQSLSLVCPQRQRIAGVVLDYAQRPVANAQLILRRAHAADKAGSNPLQNQDTGGDEAIVWNAEADGSFAGPIDLGDYAVWVAPPAESGLSRELAWADKLVDGKSNDPWTLKLHPPMVLVGTVLRSDGTTVPGVQIDVLATNAMQSTQRKDGQPPEAFDATKTAGIILDSHQLASTVTGSVGSFEVLLAPGQVAR